MQLIVVFVVTVYQRAGDGRGLGGRFLETQGKRKSVVRCRQTLVVQTKPWGPYSLAFLRLAKTCFSVAIRSLLRLACVGVARAARFLTKHPAPALFRAATMRSTISSTAASGTTAFSRWTESGTAFAVRGHRGGCPRRKAAWVTSLRGFYRDSTLVLVLAVTSKLWNLRLVTFFGFDQRFVFASWGFHDTCTSAGGASQRAVI
jgi:hypothetical protein